MYYLDDIVLNEDYYISFFLASLILYSARSIVGIPKLTPAERALISLSGNTLDAFIGIMLSDGCLSCRSISSNARFLFAQSGKREKLEYFNLVFSLFIPFMTPASALAGGSLYNFTNSVTGALYSRLSLTTMALPCFTDHY